VGWLRTTYDIYALLWHTVYYNKARLNVVGNIHYFFIKNIGETRNWIRTFPNVRRQTCI